MKCTECTGNYGKDLWNCLYLAWHTPQRWRPKRLGQLGPSPNVWPKAKLGLQAVWKGWCRVEPMLVQITGDVRGKNALCTMHGELRIITTPHAANTRDTTNRSSKRKVMSRVLISLQKLNQITPDWKWALTFNQIILVWFFRKNYARIRCLLWWTGNAIDPHLSRKYLAVIVLLLVFWYLGTDILLYVGVPFELCTLWTY